MAEPAPAKSTLLTEIDFRVIDTETTGGKASENGIMEAAVFRLQGGQVTSLFNSLINPGRPIPPWISLLTGINDDMVRNAPTFAEAAGPLHDALKGGIFTGHNAAFDYGFVRSEFERVGLPFEGPTVCTLRIARVLLADLPSRSLGMVCEHLLIDIWDRHRAYGDAEATAYVLKHLLKQLERDCGVRTWGDLEAYLAAGSLVLPPFMTFADVMALPMEPGYFVFRDAGGEMLFAGKTKNLRRRVQTLFSRANKTDRSNRLRAGAARFEITTPVSSAIPYRGRLASPAKTATIQPSGTRR